MGVNQIHEHLIVIPNFCRRDHIAEVDIVEIYAIRSIGILERDVALAEPFMVRALLFLRDYSCTSCGFLYPFRSLNRLPS